ncbi:MAG TPA: response regulator [Methylomirabilota bacterium]|jgi:two-component system CheB/CheR fusion protein|nr:response regulator [Methylomirabilota bacterium]
MEQRRSLRGTKILLLEDDRDIRDAFVLLLRAEGAEVTATASGREAARLGAEGDYDVLLTDLGIPDVPGDMVIRHVLATARRTPRVVVVTGYGDPYTTHARDAGADVVMAKPIGWPMLLDRLVPPLPEEVDQDEPVVDLSGLR